MAMPSKDDLNKAIEDAFSPYDPSVEGNDDYRGRGTPISFAVFDRDGAAELYRSEPWPLSFTGIGQWLDCERERFQETTGKSLPAWQKPGWMSVTEE